MKSITSSIKNLCFGFVFVALLSSCAAKTYQIQSIKGSSVIIDSSFDKYANPQMVDLLNKYKIELDKQMSVVIGEASRTLTKEAPGYELTFLTSDVMKQFGDSNTTGGVDLAFMNVEGHRAALNKGIITIGSIFEIYSFDNALVYVDLKGEYLSEIFEQFAQTKPQGFSSNVQLIIQDKKVISVLINGEKIDNNKSYKIITLDYLAEGNDGMEGLKKASSVYLSGVLLRDMMIDYVKQCTARGEKVDFSAKEERLIYNP
ncbi:MAG: 5'-nucleotidase C-terminal domain-containing protein [Candidatus Azobacteroides sp.]|nr:5'-nucleotidase C-terminal domain-containing protein [Candidatus Azobacteroides sp.]